MLNVGIYIFDDVEVLDFCGPYSVFSSANKLSREKYFNIFLASDNKEWITTQNGITVRADRFIGDLEQADILAVPGGRGSRHDSAHEQICGFIKKKHDSLRYLLSVCTGALILARTGLLAGKQSPRIKIRLICSGK